MSQPERTPSMPPGADSATDAPRDLPSAPAETYDPRRTGRFIGTADTVRAGETARDPREPVTEASLSACTPVPPISPGYRYVRVIGRGGFGEVWEAEQRCLDRVVAVKRLHAPQASSPGSTTGDMDSARMFRQEALITAFLEHPTIVPVHELALDGEGRAALAMKRIQGRGWGELISEEFRRLPVQEFLERHLPILEAITQAVAFAHSRGIMHRDLKPSQVLVGEFGEVYLTDWGLSLSFDPALGGLDSREGLRSLAPTRANASSPSGTPAYMAPEQTLHSAEQVGPWTDVYLLGGILYLLLTGSHPHPADRPQEAFMQARMGFVPEARRAAGGREVPEPLLALAMQALSPEPDRRPRDAGEFLRLLREVRSGAWKRAESDRLVEGVRTRLTGEESYEGFAEMLRMLGQAAELWPESPLVGPLREAVRTRYARLAIREGDLRLARLQALAMPEGEARTEATREIDRRQAELERRERARRRSRIVIGGLAVTFVVTVVAMNSSLSSALQDAQAQRLIADDARRRSDSSAERALVALESSDKLVQFVMGDLSTRLEELDRVDLLDTTADQALGHYAALADRASTPEEEAKALRGLQQVRAIYEALGNLPKALEATGHSVSLAGRRAEREPGREDVLTDLGSAFHERAMVELELGRFESAIGSTGEALRIVGTSVQGGLQGRGAQEVRAHATVTRARSLMRVGRSEEAAQALAACLAETEEALARDGGDRLESAQAELANSLGDIEFSRGRLREARDLFTRAVQARRAIMQRKPSDDTAGRNLGVAESKVGDVLLRLGDARGALEQFGKARDIHAAMVAARPQDTRALRYLGVSLSRYGQALNAFPERIQEAIAVCGEWKAIADKLTARDPTNATWKRDRAVVLHNLARLLRQTGDYDAAFASELESLEVRRSIVEERPSLESRWEVSTSLSEICTILRELGSVEDSRQYGIDALALAREVLTEDPKDLRLITAVAYRAEGLAQTESMLGHHAEALALLEEGHEILSGVSRDHPELPAYFDDVQRNRRRAADALNAAGDHEAALAIATTVLDGLSPLAAADRAIFSRNMRNLSGLHAAAAWALAALGRTDEAFAHLEKAASFGEVLPPAPADSSLPGRLRASDPGRYDAILTGAWKPDGTGESR